MFLLTLLLVSSLSAEQRILTDVQGRSITVTLLDKTSDSLLVELEDGNEFNIPLERLTEGDRLYLEDWEPPQPVIAENPTDAVTIIRGPKSSGTGFFAHVGRRTYLYTNQHVISDVRNIEVLDSRGDAVKLGALEISNSQDVARFKVKSRPALIITDNIKHGESIRALGNSEGAGVITSESGKVQGVGPNEIEVSAKFVPGNSGGPVINEGNEVIGIATYAIPPEKKPDWIKKDTRFSKTRRFTIRTSRVNDWRMIPKGDYAKQRADLDTAHYKFDQAYWTFKMLDEGAGYLSSIPSEWDRNILEILRNHNARQNRPDATKTNYYSDGYYVGSTTQSHAEKKAASKRASLRALDRYLDDEFGDLYKLRNQYLDVDYFITNKYDGADVLHRWLLEVRGEIQKEIGFSKGSF